MEIRVCGKCQRELPLSEFSIADKRTGARKRRCKACEADRVRAYYNSNSDYRERVKATARPETMVCKRCKKELSLDGFNRHPTARYGRNTVCRECKIAEGRDAVKTGRWPSFTQENQRAYHLMKRYGITPEEYDRRLSDQGGGCALCGSTEIGSKESVKFFMVDHDHNTGAVRGLLCATCNMWVGNCEQLLERVGEAKLMRYLHPEGRTIEALMLERKRAIEATSGDGHYMGFVT